MVHVLPYVEALSRRCAEHPNVDALMVDWI